jgi:hypothetical protein
MQIKTYFKHHREQFDFNRIVPTTTNLIKKLKECTTEVFNKANKVVTFPLRFLGSKTWSLPGIILRTPGNLMLRKPIFDENGYHFNFQKTLTPCELRKLLKFAAVSTASFECDSKWINQVENLEFHRFQPGDIDEAALPHGVIIGDNYLIDLETGLNIVVCENESEVIASFGCRNSHHNKIHDEAQKKCLNKIEKYSLLKSFFGASPSMYKKASSIVELLKNSKFCEGKKITLTGHSKGGSLATYAALDQKISSICINSFPLGAGLQLDLGKETLSKADQYVTHLSVKNDLYTDNKWAKKVDKFLSFLGFRTPGIFGKRFSIPSAYSDINGTHSYPCGSIMKHLGYDIRTLPSEVINAENLNSKIE